MNGLIVFFLIFAPKFGAYLDFINILSIFLIIRYFNYLRFQKSEIYFLILLLLIALDMSILIYINQAFSDIWHFFQTPRFILNFIAITAFIKFTMNHKDICFDTLVVNAILIHSLIVICGIFIPEIKDLIYSITGFPDKSPLRFAGFTNSYGVTSVTHYFGLLILLLSKDIGMSNNKKHFSLFIIILSQIFLARIGLVFSLLTITFYFFAISKLQSKILLSAIIISLVLIYPSAKLFLPESVALAIDYSSEVFLLLGSAGEIGALETVKSFIFHNITVVEVIFGTGLFGRGDFATYLATDIAWAHIFSLIGLFGILLLLVLYIAPIFINKDIPKILLIMTVVILISNYKEAFILTRSVSSVWIIYASLEFYKYNMIKMKKKLHD